MPDIIITPSTGKLEFIDNSAQVTRRHSFTLDQNDGLLLDAPLSAAAVSAPLNIINVTVNNSNVNYPFVLAQSGETGAKNLLMDGAGGTYNPFTNTATIDISGNSATATLASNSTNLGGVVAASYVTLTGTQTLTNKTITGTFTGNLTGTGSWATNAVSAVSATTATNSTQLNGQAASYYTNIPARLGYTPVNQAGDTIAGNLTVNGNFTVNGSVTAFSASNIYLSSSVLTVEDNILTLNAFSPYLRYAGIEMYDSGSGTLSQLLWDGDGDYFFLTGSSVNGKIITGPDGQTNLSSNYVPKATAGYKLGNSLIYDNGTNIGIGTTTPSGKLSTGATSGMKLLVYDNAATGVYTGLGQDLAAGNSTDLFAHSVSNLGFITFGKIGTNGTTYTEWARFNTSGYLGIGTTNPSYKLEVTGSLGVNASSLDTNWPFVVSDNSSAGSRYSLNKYGSMGFNNADNYAQLQLLGSAGAYVDFTNSIGGDSNARLIYYANSRLDLTYGFTTTVTLNSTGVGIGTTGPSGELHIYGSQPAFRIQSSVSGSMQFGQWDGTYNRIQSSARDFLLISTDATNLIFSTNTTERMRITSGGNVGIGTTSTAQKLDVVGNIRCVPVSSAWAEGLSFSMPTTSSWGGLRWRRERANADGNHYIGYVGTDTTDDLVFGSNNAGTQIDNNIRITKAGLVGVGTSSPVAKLHVVGVISGSSFSGVGTGLTGTAASLTAGTATNATQLGGVSAASYVTLNDTQSLTNKTITGTFTGALTGNASTATALTSMNISQFTNNSLYQYHRGDITSLSSSATNVVQPLGTFDGSNITNAPTSGWYNYLSSTHGSYLTSLIANLHRTSDWYVGYKEGPGGTPTNPSWFKLLHSGNYSSYTNLTASWATNAVTALNVGNGTITIAAGTGVGVGTTNTFTTNQSGATTVTISNSGVTSNVAGTGISLSGGTGAVTITNSGVTAITTNTGLSTNASATGAVTITNTGVTSITTNTGLSTNASATGAVTITNTGVTSNVAGTGISLSGGTGAVTITNSSPNATHTGDVTGATTLTIANDAVTTAKILNSNVTLAKIANITAGTILGNNNASAAAAPLALTAAQVATMLSGQTMSIAGNAATVTNGFYTTGGQTIAGITYFSNGESMNVYGIRGRFTNEYLHLYDKVGVGHPGGWGQGEGNTPTKGLSTYGGITVAYGTNATSIFYGNVGVGTTVVNARVESYYSSNAITFNYLATNLNGNSPIPVYGFDVTSGAESRSIKAGIGYERHETNGRGTMHFYNDSTNDTASLSGNRSSAGDIKMSLNNSGNLGIGTTVPSALLNIRASAPTGTGTVTTGTNILIDSNTSNYITFRNTADNGTYAGLTFLDNNTGGYIVFRNYTGDGVASGSDCMIYGSFQDHIFQNSASETINGKTETMRIKQNGYVGINTNNPTARLQVVQGNSGGVAAILLSSDESTIQGPSANTQIRMGSNLVLNASGIIPISTNGSERVRIDSSGNVGVGTTAPGQKLDVEGRIRTRGATGTGGFEIGAASSGAAKWRIEWDSASDSLDFNWVG